MEDKEKEVETEEISEPTSKEVLKIDNELSVKETENKLSMYENVLRDLLGLQQNESLDNLEEHIKSYKDNLAAKNAQLNERLIIAELKGLKGYDTKLLAKVIDRSNIKVSEDGTVTGLAEAVKLAASEYPAVVVKQDSKPYAPYNPAGTGGGTQRTMNDIIRSKRSY